MKKLSFIIFVYDQERMIVKILEKVHKLVLIENIVKEIIIINDFSIDQTEIEIQNYSIQNPSLFIQYFKNKKMVERFSN